MCVEGGVIVSYEKLLQKVAKEHSTTPEEVDKEMRSALKMAGLDIDPALFIAMSAAKVKKTINRK